MTTATQPQTIDTDALRDKYKAEREKRLRQDGNNQYRQLTGEFERYLEDPYLEQRVERAPLTDEVRVAIIGGGFGGLLTAARLKEAGVDGIRIIDSAGDFGGTWYWNRYPGVACDVESYTYLPLLEETGYMPSEKYATGREILEHAQRIGRHYDLYEDVCFSTKVKEIRWDEGAARWIIETNRGDTMRAQYVAMALGPLNQPKLPGIEGMDLFKGKAFHACRWDYDYTGGTSDGGLDKLAGKRVGIIGTGATSVQCVPHVGESAEQLYVFQRTPSSVDVKQNDPTDPEWVKTLEPGWHQDRMDNFNMLVSGGFTERDLVKDGWTEVVRRIVGKFKEGKAGELTPKEIAKTIELADFEKMEQLRGRVDEIVEDPQTAEALKPYYRQFCKRPCFHNGYLDTFNRDNVTLVDTDGQGVDRITEKGVVVDGEEYEVDCLIYASGFEVGTTYNRRAGYDVVGRGGQSMADKWDGGVRSLHGMHMHGFPNCYVISNAQSGFSASYPHMLNEQAKHIAYIVHEGVQRDAETIEATAEAEQGWVDEILRASKLRTSYQETCTPGYYNNEGRPSERSALDGFYGAGCLKFIEVLNEWRAGGALEGLEVSTDVSTDAQRKQAS